MELEAIQHDLVMEELEYILSSKGFKQSSILSAFLRFVVEQTLAGKEHEIKEYTVGMAVLGKKPGFNPMLDASVRIHAIRLRKLLKECYATTDRVPAVSIELPKGTYVPIFVGFGHKSEASRAHRSQGAAPVGSSADECICVTPFKAYINPEAPEFSVDGFCLFLSEKLSLFQDISVVSYYSANRFFSEGGEAAQLGKELGVGYYVSGSIELNGSNFLVLVQLHDALDNKIVWSHTSVSNIEGVGLVKVVDDITTQIVSAIAGYSGIIHAKKVALDGHLPPISNKLATAVFWAYHFLLNPSGENCMRAIDQLKQSLSNDTSSALGWAIMGHLHGIAFVHNYPIGKNPLAKAHEYVQRALTLNANNQHAYLALGMLHLLERNREEAIRCLEKVDSINPNSSYFNAVISQYMAFLGEFEKSADFLERALKLNPLPFWWLNLPGVLMALKDHEYEKMLFHASKIGHVSIIYNQVFEMIALYYLEDKKALKPILRGYRQQYPYGLEFVSKMLSTLVFDEKTRAQIVDALQALQDME